MVTQAQTLDIKQMLVKHLRLRMNPEEIEDNTSLFGEGLGLDSIDAIELVTVIEKVYGIVLSDEEEAKAVFRSVGTLTEYVVEHGGVS